MPDMDPNPDKDEIDEDEIDEDEDRQEKRAYDEITAWKNMRRLGFIVTEIVEHPGMLYVAEPARRSLKLDLTKAIVALQKVQLEMIEVDGTEDDD